MRDLTHNQLLDRLAINGFGLGWDDDDAAAWFHCDDSGSGAGHTFTDIADWRGTRREYLAAAIQWRKRTCRACERCRRAQAPQFYSPLAPAVAPMVGLCTR